MTSPREYRSGDLYSGGSQAQQVPGVGGFSIAKIEGLLGQFNFALAQIRELVAFRQSLAQGGGSAPPRVSDGRQPAASDLTMAELKVVGKGLLQLAIDRLGDKQIDELLKDWGPVALSQFVKML